GVAAQSIKCREATLDQRRRGGFPGRNDSNKEPPCLALEMLGLGTPPNLGGEFFPSLFKSRNEHESVVIGSGVILQQMLGNRDRRLPQDVQFPFEICPRLQAIRENYKD